MSDLPRKPTGVLAATLLILFGLALFVALAWSSHASLRELEAVTDARSRSRNGLLLAAEAMSALKDVETGQRGYVLTGDEHYLGPFETGTRSLDETFEALRRTLDDLPQASSSCTTSRSCASKTAGLPAWRRWCAGAIRASACSHPAASCRSPRTAG